jgi:hypothetical protein
MSGDFVYLPYVIILVAVMWVTAVGTALFLYKKYCLSPQQNVLQQILQGLPLSFMYKPSWVTSFDNSSSASEQPTLSSEINIAILLFFRLICAIYFWIVFILSFAKTPGETKGWFYFTTWNVALTAFYFLFVSVFSSIGLRKTCRKLELETSNTSIVPLTSPPSPAAVSSSSSLKSPSPSLSSSTFENWTQILFEVALSTGKQKRRVFPNNLFVVALQLLCDSFAIVL